MGTIAVLIDDMFEDSEYEEPARAYKRAGHTLVHVGTETPRTVRAKKDRVTVKIDRPVREAF